MRYVPFILIALILSAASVSAATCLTSSEDYAVEVVIPEYNIFEARRGAQMEPYGYAAQSVYNTELVTIFKEVKKPVAGLSIRLQIPTATEEVRKPRVKLTSTSQTGTLRERMVPTINGWTISCVSELCALQKDKVLITATSGSVAPEVSLEISEFLSSCSTGCSGSCFAVFSQSRCIPAHMKTDIQAILRYANISNSLDELFEEYRIVGSEDFVVTDIRPLTALSVSWPEALRQELVALEQRGAIDVTRDDIESIVAYAVQGQAGENYRIINNNGTWTTYNRLPGVTLSEQRDCQAYPVPDFSSKALNSFYLVPLIIVGIAVIAAIALIITGRLIASAQAKKLKKNLKRVFNS